MKRLLLIRLPEPAADTQKRCAMPPIGLWSMRTNIVKRLDGFVDVIDMHMGDDLDEALKKDYYSHVGISAQFSIQHDDYVKVAKKAKATGASVIAGGFHANAVMPPAGVDWVANGWGEEWFAQHLGYTIRGEIEHPEFSISEAYRYWEAGAPHDLRSKTERWMPFETSRGCVRHCKFCGINGVWENFRPFGLGWIDRYLKYLASKGITELFIEDDNAALIPGRFEQVLDLFQHHGITWSAPNGIEIRGMCKVLKKLKPSGCWRVSLPFETGIEETAQKMGIMDKWIKPKDAATLVKWLTGEGIETCGFFVIGWPGETLAEMQQTLDYANSLPLIDRHVYLATPYPGTALYEECKKRGFLVHDGPRLYRHLRYTEGMIKTKQWSAKQVEELRRKDREEALRRRGGS